MDDMLKIILGSSLIAAFLTQCILWIQRRFEIAKATKFAALNLSYVLEAYAYECMDRISERDTHEQSGGQVGSLPTIPEFLIPKDDFSKLKIELVDELFSLPPDIRALRDEISFVGGTACDEEEAGKLITRGLIRFGIEALELSISLRTEYGLPARSVNFGHSTLHKSLHAAKK